MSQPSTTRIVLRVGSDSLEYEGPDHLKDLEPLIDTWFRAITASSDQAAVDHLAARSKASSASLTAAIDAATPPVS